MIAVFFNVLVIKRLTGIQENAKHSWSLCSVEFFYYKKKKRAKKEGTTDYSIPQVVLNSVIIVCAVV